MTTIRDIPTPSRIQSGKNCQENFKLLDIAGKVRGDNELSHAHTEILGNLHPRVLSFGTFLISEEHPATSSLKYGSIGCLKKSYCAFK